MEQDVAGQERRRLAEQKMQERIKELQKMQSNQLRLEI